MMMSDIYGLKNSFGVSFGMSGEIKTETKHYEKHDVDIYTLTLKPNELLNEVEAKIIFEKVVEAFVIATQKVWSRQKVNYEFFKDDLKIIMYRRFEY